MNIFLPGSAYRGIRAMRRDHAPVNWSIDLGRFGFWCDLWTPVWHKGRGPYLSLGLGIIRICRGY